MKLKTLRLKEVVHFDAQLLFFVKNISMFFIKYDGTAGGLQKTV
ncbi:hypothetical protein ABE237_25320 [Brevibacillus formosus]|nr:MULTISPECIES: hypothetical protein [Brevibacillus]MED1944474.1 hypothetical protein [Brevibacillus formosus]MED1999154.1 hypothetical protein [Brevibacillus formosus]MED2082709.1 hypothetical protein [Brevibacillus formosus]